MEEKIIITNIKEEIESGGSKNPLYLASYRKSERWLPFGLSNEIPWFHLFYEEQLKYIIPYGLKTLKNRANDSLTLKEIFWFVVCVRYLKQLDKIDISFVYSFIKDCFINSNSTVGFVSKPNSVSGSAGNKYPDVHSTFYALATLKGLDKFGEFFNSLQIVDIPIKMRNYILNLKDKNGFKHCADKTCNICMTEPRSSSLYFAVLSLLLLGDEGEAKRQKIPNLGKESYGTYDYCFVLLLKKFLKVKDIDQEELTAYNHHQRSDGGFKIGEKVPASDIKETFWVAYTLENYSWFNDYNRGGVFSYILEKFRQFKPGEDSLNLETLIDYARLIILYAQLMENVISKAEDILFKNLESQTNVNINELELRGGFKKVEHELIDFISNNYNFKLSIIDHETLFRRFLMRYDDFNQSIARKIMNIVGTSTVVSLSDIKNTINHKKPRKLHVKMELIESLLNDMIKENFFTGIMEQKFLSGRVFKRQSFNEKFIISDKPIKYEMINREKVRLREVINEIHGFIRQVENTNERIMQEVESLLLFEQEQVAEQRMNVVIKNTLIEATLYDRNIENFSKEFVYLNVEPQLKELKQKWKKIYDGLQSKFQNIHYILNIKINEIKQLKNQRDQLQILENTIKESSNEIDEYIRLLDNALMDTTNLKANKQAQIESINEIRDLIRRIGKQIEQGDNSVSKISHAINTDNKDIKKRRKELISLWASKKTEFETFYQFLLTGFTKFDEFLKTIEETNLKMIEKVAYVNAAINEKISARNHSEALDILEKDINNISKELMTFSKAFREEINSFMKNNRRVHYLGLYVEEMWNQKEIEITEFFPKIRDYLRKEINLNLETRLTDDFKYEVDRAILSLQTKILETQKSTEDAIKKLVPKVAYQEIVKNYKELTEFLDSTHQNLKNHETQVRLSKPNLADSLLIYNEKWFTFYDTFKVKIAETQKNTIFDLFTLILDRIQSEQNTYVISFSEISKSVNLDNSSIESNLKEMIDRSKISGELHGETQSLILYSKDFYLNRKLKKELELELKKFDDIIENLKYIMEVPSKNNFINASNEYKSIISEYNRIRIEIDSKFDNFIETFKINQKNQQFKELKDKFYENLEMIRQTVDNYSDKLQKASEMKRNIDDQLAHLSDLLNTEIYSVEKELTKRKLTAMKKNLEWFRGRAKTIKESIDKYDTEIEEMFKKSIGTDSAITELFRELKRYYFDKKNVIVRNFEEKFALNHDKITENENERLSKVFESFIADYRTMIEQIFEKSDIDIKWNLSLYNHKEALAGLNRIVMEIKKLREKSNKAIEKKYKELVQGFKPFEMPGKFIIENWHGYYSRLEKRLIEYITKNQGEIIKKHFGILIKGAMHEYVSIGIEAKRLGIDKNIMIDRLNVLCAEGELPGKYDSIYEVYQEKDAVEIPLNEMELIKKGATTTVLFLNKLKSIFDRYNRIITSIGAIFTITGWLLSITGNWILVAMPITFLFAILLYVGWSIRKEKYSQIKDLYKSKD